MAVKTCQNIRWLLMSRAIVGEVRMTLSRVHSLRSLACALLACSTLGVAAAQDEPIEVSGEFSVVTGIVDGDVVSDADAELTVTATHVLENGVELGASGSVRADADQPSTFFAGGRYSSLLSGGDRGVGPDGGDVFLGEYSANG